MERRGEIAASLHRRCLKRHMRYFAAVLLLLVCCLLFGLRREARSSLGEDAATYAAPRKIATITDPALGEISGMTASRTARGLWWVHNDSGDRARLYVVDSNGALRARFMVTGARARDWEDLASGPGRDGKPALYIADIGDNSRVRDDLMIYRVQEPDLSKGLMDGVTAQAESFPFRYPDGRHDAESLIVDPKTGQPYIVTKTMPPPCAVYRFPMPLKANQRVTLEKVRGKAVDQISRLLLTTGAAASPDGKRVVVRTYFAALELTRPDGGNFESIFNSTPVSVNIAGERQGEAVCYSADGAAIITTSEKVPAPIYELKRRRANAAASRP